VNELIDKCSQWSIDRQIIQNGNRETQCLKLVSEIGELADNIAKGRDVYDDIGDCLVVLNNLALMHGTTLEQCLAHAYNDIKDRKGYMNDKGIFIKENDK
jgi:NTP pyrophosphatase (non-canonical NTP hydrolase)